MNEINLEIKCQNSKENKSQINEIQNKENYVPPKLYYNPKNNLNNDISNKFNIESSISLKKNKNKNFIELFKDYYNSIINNHQGFDLHEYIIFKDLIIGQDTFKTVFFGVKKQNKEPIVIKICNIIDFKNKKFENEKEVMKAISDDFFFPKTLDCLRLKGKNYLIEKILGQDLFKFVNFVGLNYLTKKTIYRIAIDLLYNIKKLHQKGFLHLDLKLDNIASLFEPIEVDNYFINFTLIDFGLACQYKVKNHKFASPDSLEKIPVGAKDDLISICYIIISLIMVDKLPWNKDSGDTYSLRRKNNAKKKKKFNDTENIGNNYKELSEIYNEIYNLKKDEEPNYDKYINKLKQSINYDKKSDEKENMFDWDKEIIKKKIKFKRIRGKLKDDFEIRKIFKATQKK